MLKSVYICENSLDLQEAEHFEVENVLELLSSRWKTFPNNTRIYHQNVCEANDVTPQANESSIAHFQTLEGTFYVITYPEFFFIGLFTAFNGLFGILLLGLISYLLRPKPPKPKNAQENSPNNGLSDRKNEARPLARIPDIFGKVRSTPDLIAKPYTVFENHREVEFAYMCVGRGSYLIEDIRDDITPVDDIGGVSVEVYGPNTSPHSGDPEIRIGSPINERVWLARRSNAVNGQILRAPNASTVKGDDDLGFVYPDQIVSGAEIDFEEFFAPDDVITISNSTYTEGAITINLDGTYVVLAVTANTITLVDPSDINPDWNELAYLPEGQTDYYSPRLNSSTDKWVGPFLVEEPYAIYNNFIAVNGLYKDDGRKQKQFDVEIEIQFTPVDKDGNQIGPMQDTTCKVVGSSVLRNSRAVTDKYTVAVDGNTDNTYWKVRARRITPADLDFEGRVIDEVQWRDMFGMKYVFQSNFGNITTIHAKTYATSGALSIKDRKLNCHATRKIPARIGSSYLFTDELYPTEDAFLIFVAMCVDPYIGRRTLAEIDLVDLFRVKSRLNDYFGTDKAYRFNHTFDDANLSFEDLISAVAEAIFCKAYRLGNLLKLNFERNSTASRLIFNHRNKIPRSEQRSINFGNFQDNDGIDLEWVDQKDGATLNFLLPADGSAINPKKITTVGIQNEIQAHFHAWRQYQKLLYQRVAVEFEATSEAAFLNLNDRITVADNTRPDTVDGEIVSQDGLTLTLSQPFDYDGSKEYIIYLQLSDGTVQILDIDSSPNEYQVVLANAPRLPLVTDEYRYAKSGYVIATVDNLRENFFLVQEKEINRDKFTIKVSAINMDSRYYIHDKDYIDGEFDDETLLFQANFEEHNVPRGGFAAFANPGGFDASGNVEVQNNVLGVGPAAEGDKHCELDGTLRIWKDLTTNLTKSYRLLLNYSPRPGVSEAENAIAVYWGGNYLQTLLTDGLSNTTTEWEFFDIMLPAVTSTTTRLEFRSVIDGGLGMGGLIDNIRVMEIN